jgi:hypothetical protein
MHLSPQNPQTNGFPKIVLLPHYLALDSVTTSHAQNISFNISFLSFIAWSVVTGFPLSYRRVIGGMQQQLG